MSAEHKSDTPETDAIWALIKEAVCPTLNYEQQKARAEGAKNGIENLERERDEARKEVEQAKADRNEYANRWREGISVNKELERERDTLKRLLVAVVNEGTDGCAAPDVSLEFLQHVPKECAGMKRQRDEARELAADETVANLLHAECKELRARVAALEKDKERLVEAHRKIVAAQPGMNEGGCFYPMHDGDGEYIGEQNVDPLSVIQEMARVSNEAIDAAMKGQQ